MGGKQIIVMSGKKVVYISDIFTTEEKMDIEFQKALEVYEKYTKKRSVLLDSWKNCWFNYGRNSKFNTVHKMVLT